MDGTLEKLAECVAGVTMEQVPPEVLHQAKLRLLDYLGCLVGAFAEEPSKAVRRVAMGSRCGEGGATLLGTKQRCSADVACFANGMMGRYLDFNDQYSGRTTGHPSDVIPAALAASELSGGGGAALVTGMLTGYELFGRLCDAVTLRPRWDHVTLGAIASTGATSNAMGLGREETRHAISIATVSNVSLDQTRRGELSHWKAGAFPNAARQGLFAAMLAKEGVSGPDLPFEGEQGFWKAVASPDAPEALDGEPGRFKLMESAIKAHSACYLDLSAVDAMLELRREIRAEDVERVVAYVYQYSIDMTADGPSKWRPQTRETADHSMPFVLATALREGYVGPEHYEPGRFSDPEVVSLMDRVEVREEPRYTAGFPQVQSQRVEVTTRSGAKVVKEIDYPKGHPARPMSDAEVEGKFGRLVGGLLSEEQRRRAVEEVMGVESRGELSGLVEALVVEGG